MAFNNDVAFVGNLTRDPELRYSESGKPRANFGVAINEGRGDNEKAHFVNVTCFGDLAENVAESLSRGDRAVVRGSIDTYQKTTEVDGEEKKTTVVQFIANDVGADLHFAKVKVTKVRHDHDEDDEAPKAKSDSKAKSSSKSSEKPAPKAADNDEEDF